MQSEPKPNPLASDHPPAPADTMHPMKAHALIWQHAQSLPSDELSKAAALANYSTPILGALAGDQKVTRKDVIRAAADAVVEGKIQPSEATKFLSQMPEDPKALRTWLHSLYAVNMTKAVHFKAAMMKNGIA